MRIKRNCTTEEDYQIQAEKLTAKFREKGYTEKTLKNVKQEVSQIERQSLLQTKCKNDERREVALIAGYNKQYKQVEKIYKKHWPILLKDQDLRKCISEVPKFIYRKAPGLRNQVARNVPDPPKKTLTFLDIPGFHNCTRCKACKTTRKPGASRKRTQFKSHVTGENFQIKPLITCDSDHVTYVIECPCPLQYVGRTTRKLRIRINEHLANIRNDFPNHSVSRHFSEFHKSDPTLCVFYGIDKLVKNWRGTHMTRSISQNETMWINKMQTMHPTGLNIELDLNCFLAND